MFKTKNKKRIRVLMERRYCIVHRCTDIDMNLFKDSLSWHMLQLQIALIELKYSVLEAFGIQPGRKIKNDSVKKIKSSSV